MGSPARAAVRDATTVLFAQVAAAALAFALSVVVARGLGPAGVGVVHLAQTFGNQLALLFSLGLTVSLVRATALDPTDKRPFSAALVILGLLMPVFGLVLLVTPTLAELVVDAEDQALALVLSVPLAWVFLGQDFTLAVFRGMNRYRAVAVATVATRAAVTVAAVATVVVWSSPDAVVLTVLLVNALAATAMVGAGARVAGVDLSGGGRAVRQLVRFNAGGHAGTVLQELSYRLDLFLVAGMRSTADAGVYGVAGLLCTLLWYVPNAVGTVLMSRVPTRGGRTLHSAVVDACRTTLAAMTVLCIASALASPFFVPALFGERFSDAVAPFVLLLPGVVLLSGWKVVANAVAGLGHPSLKVPSAALGAAVGVVLDLWLIPTYGIRGAALAATLAYTATAFAFARPAGRILGVDARLLLIPDFKLLWAVAVSPGLKGEGARKGAGGN